MKSPTDTQIMEKEAAAIKALLPTRDSDMASISVVDPITSDALSREHRRLNAQKIARARAKEIKDKKLYGEYSKKHFEEEAAAEVESALRPEVIQAEPVVMQEKVGPAERPTPMQSPIPIGGPGITSKEVIKLMASLNINLNVQLTKTDTHNLLATLLTCNELQLKALLRNPKVPMAIKAVITRIIKDAEVGEISTIERLWDRVFGKNMLEVSMPSGYAGIIPNAPVSREAYVLIHQTLIG